MALRWSLDRADLADKLFSAVGAALEKGARTPDLGGAMTTVQMADAVLTEL
jgi:3-isopropylmalate dehydrogenase